MEYFVATVNGYKLLIIVAKRCILDDSRDPGLTSDSSSHFLANDFEKCYVKTLKWDKVQALINQLSKKSFLNRCF